MEPSLLLGVVLALFALLTAWLVYRYDLYEHEPIPLLGVAIALGAGAMWLAGRVEGWAIGRLAPGDAIGIAAVAASTEEILKLLVVVAVALLARREFDDPMDGVVYGSMAGLGMALEESRHYLGQPSAADPFAAGELVRLWAHVVLGGIVGFPLGFYRSRAAWAAAAALVGLAVAGGLHFAWDAVVLATPPSARQAAVGIGVMAVSLSLYGWLVTRASRQSRRELAPGSPLRLWGWPFVPRPPSSTESPATKCRDARRAARASRASSAGGGSPTRP